MNADGLTDAGAHGRGVQNLQNSVCYAS